MEKWGRSAKPAWSPLPAGPARAARIGRKAVKATSITRVEIDKFWRRKRAEEEDHLIAAQKAAARIRARTLTEGDYRRFEESLRAIIARDDDEDKDEESTDEGSGLVGIKDWWTKSKYAYLNQPSIKSMGENVLQKRDSSKYTPQMTCFFNCSAIPPFTIPSSLGVF